jgi:hypothetical protein
MALMAVSREKHADLCISSSNTLLQFIDKSSLPLYGLEVGKLACDYPLFFSPIEDTYGIRMMCSIDPNLGSVCITKKGEWTGFYAPACLRSHPFAALINAEDDQQCVICIDNESPMLGEEGKALFDDGEPTEYLKHVIEFIGTLHQAGKQTSLSMQAIQDADLIVPWEINVPRSEGETIQVSDKYRIDEGKLNALEDRQWIELKEAGALTIIYGQLFSQGNVNKLVSAHNSINQGGSEPELDFLIGDEEFSLNFDEV